MEVSVESTGSLERKMTVQVPPERIEQEVERRLEAMRPRVKMPGFRPGKVPYRLVKQRYGADVRQEVLGEVLRNSLDEALTQEALQPAGQPHIEPRSGEPGQGLEYVATFEVYPRVELGNLAQIVIRRPQAEVTEADVDQMIETLRRQRTEWEAVERQSQQGDRVTIDFEGSLNGEPFEGNQASDVQVIIGQGRLLEAFESQLAGMAPGEERTIDVSFPEQYQAEQLAGRTAQFWVYVKAVEAPRLPDVDADLARAFGIDSGDVQALRREVRQNMERELEQAVKSQVKSQVMDGLYQQQAVALPTALVQEEIGRLRQQAKESTGVQDDNRLPDELFDEEARKRVALGLIVGEVVRQHDIQLDKERVQRTLEATAATYEDPQEVIDYYRSNREAMSSIEAMVLEDQVVDWVLEQAQVSDEPTTFEAVMNPGKTGEQS